MNILTLDGGGSKGIYTLGILTELEAMLPVPIHEQFDYIYGTSTGSIIAALLPKHKRIWQMVTGSGHVNYLFPE